MTTKPTINIKNPPSALKREPLDQRITQLLKADDVDIDSLERLIAEAEGAAADSGRALERERAYMLDPTHSIDLAKSRQTIADIEIEQARLEAALPRLREKLAGIEAAERFEFWSSKRADIEAHRNELCGVLAKLYENFMVEVVPVLDAIEISNRDIRTLNANLREKRVSISALEEFPAEFLNALKLPAWHAGGETYPPYRPLNVMAATSVPKDDLRYSGGWWKAKEIEDEAKLAAWAEREARQKADEVKKRDEYNKRLVAADRARRLGQKPQPTEPSP